MTEAEQQEIDEATARLRRLGRGLVIALVIGLSGIVLASASLWATVASNGRETERNAWDAAEQTNEDCVAMATSRTNTIALGEDDFEREQLGIDDDASTVDLIEQNVLGLIAYAGLPPDAPIVVQSTENIAARRAKLEVRQAKLDEDKAAFFEKRTPLDPADCPPPPAGPRP